MSVDDPPWHLTLSSPILIIHFSHYKEKEKRKADPFRYLPLELVMLILSYLDYPSLRNVRETCRHWARVVENKLILDPWVKSDGVIHSGSPTISNRSLTRWRQLAVRMEREERWREGKPASWASLNTRQREVVQRGHPHHDQDGTKDPILRFQVAGEVMVTLSASKKLEVWRWRQDKDETASYSWDGYLPFGSEKKWFQLCPSGRRLVSHSVDKGVSFWSLELPASASRDGKGYRRRDPLFHQPRNFSQSPEVPVAITGEVYASTSGTRAMSLWEHQGGQERLRWVVNDAALVGLTDTLIIPQPGSYQSDLPKAQYVMMVLWPKRIWVYDVISGIRLQDFDLGEEIETMVEGEEEGEGGVPRESLDQPRLIFSSGRRPEDRREVYVCIPGKAFILRENMTTGESPWEYVGQEIFKDEMHRPAIIGAMDHDRALALLWAEEVTHRCICLMDRRASPPRTSQSIDSLFHPSLRTSIYGFVHGVSMDGRCIYSRGEGLEIPMYSFDPMLPLSHSAEADG